MFLLTRDVGAGRGLWGSSTSNLKPGGLSTPTLRTEQNLHHRHRHRLVFGQSTIHLWLLQPIVNQVNKGKKLRKVSRSPSTYNQGHSDTYAHKNHIHQYVVPHHRAQVPVCLRWRWRFTARLNEHTVSLCMSCGSELYNRAAREQSRRFPIWIWELPGHFPVWCCGPVTRPQYGTPWLAPRAPPTGGSCESGSAYADPDSQQQPNIC